MASPRANHTATLLTKAGPLYGKVLIVGGWDGTQSLNTVEIFDPATGEFRATAGLANARNYHAATVLSDGNILITGGRTNFTNPFTAAPTPIAGAEIFQY